VPRAGQVAGEILDDLRSGLEEARSRRRGRTLVSATRRVDGVDPCAVAFTLRLASEPWFAWAEPDRGFSIGAVGTAFEATSRGPERFTEVNADCLRLLRDSIQLLPEGPLPAGSGALFTGGFAFSADGGSATQWSSFAPASMVLPQISLARQGDETFLTVNVVAGAGHDPEETVSRLAGRLAALGDARLPMLDPARTGRTEIRGARPPGEFERVVAAAVERIRAGALTKVVLAREVVVEAPAAHDAGALFGALRELFPECFCFCRGTPEGAFIGASPELLVRRSGASAQTVALAGSTRRSSDPAVDAHLGEQLLRSDKDRREQEIVTRRIVRKLEPHAVWVERARDPEVIRIANIQHLATPIVAQLTQPRSAIEMAGLLHPTPAVGGEPWAVAEPVIGELEEMDRGWYAGAIGWMDATEDGEFCVGLRSALLRDRQAHLYAGVGVVEGSDPAAELAETEIKLGALLPLLSD
jgi:salicylate biosynthesis isochorismate synthase/menaquinone-specific isochorismate synthase